MTLYTGVLLDHGRSARHRGRLPSPTHEASRSSPICGDTILLSVRVLDRHLAELAFDGCACILARASASMMIEAMRERPCTEAKDAATSVRAFLDHNEPLPPRLDALRALEDVHRFPARKSCVLLAWLALLDVVEDGP